MKLLTLSFLTCAIKSCKSHAASFPLHIRDAELEEVELDFNPLFIRNVIPRVEWKALETVVGELGLQMPPAPPEVSQSSEGGGGGGGEAGADVQMEVEVEVKETQEAEEKRFRQLHTLLLETQIVSGKLVCGNCGHEYAVREGIANFLLPAHLV